MDQMYYKSYQVSRFAEVTVSIIEGKRVFGVYNLVSGLPVGDQLDNGDIQDRFFSSYEQAKSVALSMSNHYRSLHG
jgi:hypothetical protein